MLRDFFYCKTYVCFKDVIITIIFIKNKSFILKLIVFELPLNYKIETWHYFEILSSKKFH